MAQQFYSPLQLNSTLTVGADGAGQDVKFFLNASGRYIIVDEDDNSLIFTDNASAKFGNGGDLQLMHDGTDSRIDNMVGHLKIRNYSDDSDIIFESDNGSGGTATYFKLDGSSANSGTLYTQFPDNSNLTFGSADDLQIKHDGTDSKITNSTGDLVIRNLADDKDVILQSDDGSGGVTAYLTLDGSAAKTIFHKIARIEDNVAFQFGTGGDAFVRHTGADFEITQSAGNNLIITNEVADKDIILKCDDGSGGETAYLTLDGSAGHTVVHKEIQLEDSVTLRFGTSNDAQMSHSGSDFYFANAIGDVDFYNHQDDGDISFFSDDGSGGTTEYFRLDGSDTSVLFSQTLKVADSKYVGLGDSFDFHLQHNGTDSKITNSTGDLYIINGADDKDIIFQSDDGSGGTATYITIDGSAEQTEFAKHTSHKDSVAAYFGDWLDLQIYHDGSNSYIKNGTGDLYIRQNTNDKDLILQCDDGSGGITAYLTLDGSAGYTTAQKSIAFADGTSAFFGTGLDSLVSHSGTNMLIANEIGDLVISNRANDKDIQFQSDDGSGGYAEYFRLDGSQASSNYYYTVFPDKSSIVFGDSNDLRVYHDSTDSSIENETGHLYIQQKADDKDIIFRCDDGSGGTTAYLTLDGSAGLTVSNVNMKFNDGISSVFGTGADSLVRHTGTNMEITNSAGNIVLSGSPVQVGVDDTGHDVIFYGATSGAYLQWDESGDALELKDSTYLYLGTSNDLQLYHNATNSYIINETGNLYIRNSANDADIILQSDDGSGGTTAYITLDGSQEAVVFGKAAHIPQYINHVGDGDTAFGFADNDVFRIITGGTTRFNIGGGITMTGNTTITGTLTVGADDTGHDVKFFGATSGKYLLWDESADKLLFADNTYLALGASSDLLVYHDGSDSAIVNAVGSLYIDNNANDEDIVFRCDDGSGGTTTYLTLDGSAGHMVANKEIQFLDNVVARFGTGNDLTIYHTGTATLFDNNVGDMSFRQYADDGDMVFYCDDGSGGVAEYIRLDGGLGYMVASKHILLDDSVRLRVGSSADFEIQHDGSNTHMINTTGDYNITTNSGDMYIANNADDKDIILMSDDGSGGVTAYLTLDGGNTQVQFAKNTNYVDSIVASFGSSGDLKISHGGTNSSIENETGNLYIINDANDADIVLQCDDGSGGVTDYITLDGSAEKILAHKGIDLTGSLTFTQSSAAFINHNVTSQSVKFRLSNSSALDVVPLEITPTYVVLDADLYASSYIRHSGDSDTLIGFSGNDTFIINTGGTTALTVDSSQNATFAGKILVGTGATAAASLNAYTQTVSSNLFSALRVIENTGASSYWDIGATGGSDTILNFFHNANTTPKITFTHTGGATFAGDVTVSGNLTVSGTTTTVNQTNLDVADNIIGLNRGSASNTNDSGIIIERGDVGNNAALIWDEGDDHFVLGTTTSDASSTGGSIVVAGGNLKLGGLLLDGKSITGVDNQENFTNADDHIMTSAAIEDKILGYSYTANALPLAGGTMTGNITFGSGLDILFPDNSGAALEFKEGSNLYMRFITTNGAEKIEIEKATTISNSLQVNALTATTGDFSGNVAVEDEIHLTDGGSTVRGKLLLNSSDTDNVELRAESLGSTMKFFTVGTEALLLDASQNATFAGNIAVGGTVLGTSAKFGRDAHNVIDFATDNHITFKTDQSTALQIDSNQSVKVISGSLQISGDNANFVTLTESGSGDFTIDAADDIRLDAGGGDIVLRDDGTEYGRLSNSSSDFWIAASVQDKDIVFRGNDNGSYISALTLDMSDGGAASFAGNVTAGAADTAAKFKAFHSDGAYTEQSGTGLVLSRSNSYIQSSADNSTTLNIGQSSVRWGHVKVDGADFAVLNGGNERFKIDSSGNATFSGSLTIPDYINHAGDSGTKFGFSADDTFVVTTGSTERFTVDSSGRANFAGNADVTGNVEARGYLQAFSTFYMRGTTQVMNKAADGFLSFLARDTSGSETVMNISNVGTLTTAGLITAGAGINVTGNIDTPELSINDYVKHNGDTNTYFGFSGADTYVLATGGTTALTVNSSQAATFTGDVQAAGVYVGSTNTSFDFYNNGTSYLNGAVTVDSTLTVGVDDTGYDVKFFGATSGSFMLWDESTDSLNLTDNSYLNLGDGGDLQIYHSGVSSAINNTTGPLYIKNGADDEDIIFQCDDGSGGQATYFYLDGSLGGGDGAGTVFTIFPDNARAGFGGNADLRIYHDGADSKVINLTGNLTFDQRVDDGDMIFKCDDGSGGVATYLTLDGGISSLIAYRDILLATDGANGNLKLGAGQDLVLNHDGSNSYIKNATGDLYIQQNADDKDLVFQCDDGSGVSTAYLTLDGSIAKTTVSRPLKFNDNISAEYGTDTDMIMYSSGSHGYIENYTGDLRLINNADNSRIRFQADNGAGGVATYFDMQGGSATHNGSATTALFTQWYDNSRISFGNGHDTQIYHDGTNTNFYHQTGDLYFKQAHPDGDIIFQCDDGSGSIENYIQIDGSEGRTLFNKHLRVNNNVQLQVGSSAYLKIYNDGTDSYFQQTSGDMYFYQGANDKDISFQTDNGSGGVTEYFRVDGAYEVNRFLKNARFNDSVKANFGTNDDLQMYHDGSHSYIDNTTGNLYIRNLADDADVIFRTDDGAGDTAEYLKLKGSTRTIEVSAPTNFGVDDTGYDVKFFGATSGKYMQWDESADTLLFPDNTYITFGGGSDATIGVASDNLAITNATSDKDIIFTINDGGSSTEVARFDGSRGSMVFSDSQNLEFGDTPALQLYHNGAHSLISNQVGALFIRNQTDGQDIIFQCDDGSGGDTTYITLDGSATNVNIHTDLLLPTDSNGGKIKLGASQDLQIYHSGSHSYVDANNTGDLYIRSLNDDVVVQAADDVFIYTQGGEDAIIAKGDGGVELYHNNVKKFETTSGGITVVGTVTAAKLSTDTVTIVEDAKTDTALMTLTGAGSGTEANVALKLSGTVHGNPIKMKMVAENASGNVTGAGMLSYEPDDDNFNIGQSTTHNRMGVSIGNTVTIGDSDIIYQEDVTIKSRAINMTANSSHYEFNGDIMKIGNDTTTRGKLYNYKNGTWTLADKDAEADADGLLAMAVGTNSTTHGMLLRGTMTLDYDPGGAGDVLYVGDSGVIQNSAPSGSGDIVRIVGYLLGGTHGNIFFDPDKTFVEVA